MKILPILLLLSIALPRRLVRAGCGLNFDKMRHRRLQAIRGQILSKLGFNELPKNDTNVDPPTVEQMRLYDMTKEFVNEQARRKQAECEKNYDDWYAQDIITVYDYDPEDKDAYEEVNEPRANYFHFNLKDQDLEPEELVTATMRIFHKVIRYDGEKTTQTMILNEIVREQGGNGRRKRILHTVEMDLKTEGFTSLDVTDTVRRWLENPDDNLGFELTLPCPGQYNVPNSTQLPENTTSRRKREPEQPLGRGDRDVDSVPSRPRVDDDQQRRGNGGGPSTTIMMDKKMMQTHLVIMRRTAAQHENKGGNRRSKRSTTRGRRLDASFCLKQKPPSANCCLRELYIDFQKDLNWSWVVSPSGYKANFCAGACPYMYSGDTMHYSILYMHRMNNPNASPSPCCTPKEYAPLTIMFRKDGKYRIRQLNDLLVVSCGCG